MQFLFFAAQYLPTVGGVERYTYNLARTLAAKGHGATVVTSALPGLPEREVSGGVEIFRLPAWLLMRGRFPVPRKNKDFRRLSDGIWRKNYDFAVINTKFYPLSLWAAGECGRRALPAMALEHGSAHLTLGSRPLDLFVRLYEHLAAWRIRRRCPAFYGVSLACCRWLSHFHIRAEGVLYNSVDIGDLKRAADGCPADFRRRFQIERPSLMVVFSGRIVREKGIFLLLEAFGDFLRSHPGAGLVVAGDGPALAEIQRRGLPRVFLPGRVSHAENIALLRQADIFCLPSYSEGFPTAALEAAAMRTFVIASAAGGIPELISDGVSGILLEELSASAVAGALERAADPDFRKAAAGGAYDELLRRFTWDETARRLIRIAEEAAGQNDKKNRKDS